MKHAAWLLAAAIGGFLALSATQLAGAEGRCALLSVEEVARALNAPVHPGETAGPLGTACQWNGRDHDEVYLQVRVIDDTNYWSTPRLAAGFRRVAGIGKEAYVVPEMGGWSAGALMENRLAVVALSGTSANAEAAIEVLRTVVSRLQ